MKPKIKILHLEDLYTDAMLVARELKKGKIDSEIKVVDNRIDFKKALVDFVPDIVLCDHSLASFNSIEALKIINELDNKIPFILVTATVSEDFAVEVMKQGAYDYILKDRLQRLPGTVRNASEKKAVQKQAMEDLKHSEDRYRQIVETAQEGIWLMDENNRTTFVNRKMCEILEYSEEEMIGKENVYFMGDNGNLAEFTTEEKRRNGMKENIDMPFVTKSGRNIWTNISSNQIFDDHANYKGTLRMVSDITEKKTLVQELLDQKVEEQRNISKAVENAQEKERSEIGMELHDNIGQLLAASKLFLDHGLSKKDYAPSILQSQECIIMAIAEIRKLSHELVGPAHYPTIGLVESVEKLIHNISIVKDIKIDFVYATFQERKEDVALNLVIYRIIQEQMNNILKHADASETEIRLETEPDHLVVTIKDNGKGFNTKAKRAGIGLKNIKNRAEMHNGCMQIFSVPGKGCQVKIIFETTNNKKHNPVKSG
ncbi:MAG: PAS domain S-box protein [Chitinophagaceae bacterium]